MNHTVLFRRASRHASMFAVAVLAVCPIAASGQSSADDDGLRVGVSFGGVSTFGIVAELFSGKNSVELTLGTWSFKDLSLSAVAKRYILSGDVRPFVGGGFWLVLAKPPSERMGMAFVLRAPVGLDVTLLDDHHFDATLNLNRALGVRRTDPADDTPLNRRLVPLPGVGYRYEIR